MKFQQGENVWVNSKDGKQHVEVWCPQNTAIIIEQEVRCEYWSPTEISPEAQIFNYYEEQGNKDN